MNRWPRLSTAELKEIVRRRRVQREIFQRNYCLHLPLCRILSFGYYEKKYLPFWALLSIRPKSTFDTIIFLRNSLLFEAFFLCCFVVCACYASLSSSSSLSSPTTHPECVDDFFSSLLAFSLKFRNFWALSGRAKNLLLRTILYFPTRWTFYVYPRWCN